MTTRIMITCSHLVRAYVLTCEYNLVSLFIIFHVCCMVEDPILLLYMRQTHELDMIVTRSTDKKIFFCTAACTNATVQLHKQMFLLSEYT